MDNKIINNNKKYSSKKLENDLNKLKEEYKKELEIKEIGKSTLNQSIYLLKIGSGKNKIMINAAHHANEWMTSLVLMMFVEKILKLKKENKIYKNYNINQLLKENTLYIIPMVNPDGVDLVLKDKDIINNKKYQYLWKNKTDEIERWKSNIRGVDLNLNYPTGWGEAKNNKEQKGIVGPGFRDFVGEKPLSEIETKIMVEITNQYLFDLTISLHHQGQEIYWCYRNEKNEKAYKIGKKFEEVSGYLLTEPDYYSAFGGYKEWFINNFHKIGYTIEIGKGQDGLPLNLKNANDIYKEIEEIFLVAMKML